MFRVLDGSFYTTLMMNYYFDESNKTEYYNNIKQTIQNDSGTSYLSTISPIYKLTTGVNFQSPPEFLNLCNMNQNKINFSDTCYCKLLSLKINKQ